MSIKRHIYIELLDEGTTIYRPVLSTMIGKDVFILGPKEDNEETWAFEPGETVEVEPHTFADGECGLLAVRKYLNSNGNSRPSSMRQHI